MHRNYRRKPGRHNPKREGRGGTWHPPSFVSYLREYWRKQRARVRTLMHHERYEDIQDRHPKTMWWDLY